MSDLISLNAKVQADKAANANVRAWIGAATAILEPAPPPPLSSLMWLLSAEVNTRIVASPAVNPKGPGWMEAQAAAAPAGIWPNGTTAPLGAGSPTVYDAALATTTAKLTQTRDGSSMIIRWNPAWAPSPGGDQQWTSVDWATGDVVETQQFDASDPANLKCQGFATNNIRTGTGAILSTANRVSWVSLLLGINTAWDYTLPEILHAGRAALSITGPTFVSPALGSDGKLAGGPPQGCRLWLPRSVSLSQWALDEIQTANAVQLQEFGHVNGDTGGGYSQAFESVAGPARYPAQVNPLPPGLIAKLQVLA